VILSGVIKVTACSSRNITEIVPKRYALISFVLVTDWRFCNLLERHEGSFFLYAEAVEGIFVEAESHKDRIILYMKHELIVSALMIAFILACFSAVSLERATAFAEYTLATGRISGTVWRDTNNNGIREPQELPLVGYPVYLQRVGAEVVGTMVAVVYTDENGVFVFDTLEEGQYQIFPEEGDYVLVEVVGMNGRATIDLPIPVYFHQLYLPMTVR
jgi:hypothetical protein